MYSLKYILNKKKGSVAILLATMVSVGVLFTIYFTQKMAGDFLSSRSQSMEEWEKYLVTLSAQNLAAYLIANNIILCREEGWEGKPSKCIWSTADNTDKPSHFKLSNLSELEESLSLDGNYTVDEKDIVYSVHFNLVNWRDKPIQNVIGEIPEYVCRNNDMSIIQDASPACPAYKDVPISGQHNQTCGSGGTCEYISPVDADYYIVLITVEIPFKDPVSALQKKHTSFSGIRRPLSMVSLKSIVPGRKCTQSCGIGKTTAFAPDCRSNLTPLEEGQYTAIGSKIITIKNEGPGAMYKLSVLKTEVELSTNIVKIDVTPNIMELVADPRKEVLHPEEELTIEYFYTCPHTVRTEVVYVQGSTDKVTHEVKDTVIPFSRIFFSLYTGQDPVGACYASAGETLTATTNVDAVIPLYREILNGAICSNEATSCSSGGKSGTCQYVEIEPRRLFASPDSQIASEIEQRITSHTTTISISVPPINTVGGGGGDGDGDGGGN